jgi:hypothetical protein
MKTKQTRICQLLALGALTLGGCAAEAAPVEAENDHLAETTYPAPTSDADKVNWQTAGMPNAGTDPRSDFMRAQHLMAKLSAAAYQDQTEFDQRMNPLGLRGGLVSGEAGLFGATKPDAYVGGSERLKMTFVAIRGSSDANDYGLTNLFNAPTFPTRYGNDPITLHQGFAIYADKIYELAKPQLALSCAPQPEAQRVPLWVTGHSLGAAAASVVAYRLAAAGCNVAGVALFGSPRPGLSDFQQAYFNSPTLLSGNLQLVTQRWVNGHDPIYCLPPGGAWKHVGIENHIDGGKVDLGTNILESQCSTPEDWIGGVKLGLQLSGLAPGAVASEIHQALLDWLAGLIKLSLVCQPGTHWDDLWSLGGCSLVDTSHRLGSVYNITPLDLFTSAVRFIYTKQHFPGQYVDGIHADFSEGGDPNVQWAKLRVIVPRHPFGGPVYPVQVVEELMQGTCTPDIDAADNQLCEFDVPVGYTAKLVFAVPELSFAGRQCVREGGDAETAFCEVQVEGDATIQADWVFYL